MNTHSNSGLSARGSEDLAPSPAQRRLIESLFAEYRRGQYESLQEAGFDAPLIGRAWSEGRRSIGRLSVREASALIAWLQTRLGRDPGPRNPPRGFQWGIFE